jgi:hypothetical protein
VPLQYENYRNSTSLEHSTTTTTTTSTTTTTATYMLTIVDLGFLMGVIGHLQNAFFVSCCCVHGVQIQTMKRQKGQRRRQQRKYRTEFLGQNKAELWQQRQQENRVAIRGSSRKRQQQSSSCTAAALP